MNQMWILTSQAGGSSHLPASTTSWPLMPGMSMASYPPAIAVSLFYHSLLAVAIFLGVVVFLVRPWLRRVGVPASAPEESKSLRYRKLLAYWLGALWLLDGLMQMQPEMVTRFVGGFLAPLLSGQPAWARAVIAEGIRLWSLSPIWFNVGAAFIQLLIGVVLLFTRDGAPLRRYALYVSIGWGVMVWTVGEAFGSLFNGGGPLDGSPGAVLLYMIAAVLLLLPPKTWDAARLWRWMARGIAANFFLLAVLASWPAFGWWGKTGVSFVQNMGQMPQPALFAQPLLAFAATYGAHPVIWNAIIVGSCLLLGVFWLIRPRSRGVIWATLAWTFLVWFFGQDFGLLGGMGTDPNTGGILMAYIILWGMRWGILGRRAEERSPVREVMAHSPQ